MSPLLIAVVLFLFVIVFVRKRKKRSVRMKSFIESYQFPVKVHTSVKQHYPHLSESDTDLVVAGLREYFYICLDAKKGSVAMPSQVVDVAWHEFILFTKAYESFCTQAFGKFLHHTPAEAMKTPVIAQDGIKLAWRLSCIKEGINPQSPSKLPFIFALDARLKIQDGFHYALNCQKHKSAAYCASHIGCGGGCSSDSSDSGCSGGCGGD
jgi:hypothetical protein